jgi:DNA (cytosine-5)-methyltransferase 1
MPEAMRFLSVCSGIEAASVAWGPLGWKAVAFSEIEPFPCSVLAHHYPDTPNWGDMTKYKDWPDVSIDLLCGGTPCQSFSVAGLRKGLDDPRGNLMLTFGAIAAKYRPKWLVWENVPGVLSSNAGADFGAFLGMLGQLGYGFAYRVLDAQYFGVAQRRRRVFVVGCFGDWRSAAAVLFERYSLQGHPAPRREAGKAAPTIPSRSTAGGGLGTDFDCDGGLEMPTMDQRAGRSGANSFATSGGLVPVPHAAISPALKARDHKGVSSDGDGDGAILVPMLAQAIAFPERMSGTQCASTENLAPSMGATNPTAVAFNMHKSGNEASSLGISEDRTDCLRAFEKAPFAVQPQQGMMVRRLTPMECERLQGFPDDYTNVPHRNKPAADGPRYKALGNSWAVPNVRWIGERIQAVDAIRLEIAA